MAKYPQDDQYVLRVDYDALAARLAEAERLLREVHTKHWPFMVDGLHERVYDFLNGAAVSAPAAHYPVEFGPSDARRLECACGNPDPAHSDSALGVQK